MSSKDSLIPRLRGLSNYFLSSIKILIGSKSLKTIQSTKITNKKKKKKRNKNYLN
jgi:hypothetical protein